MSVQEVRFRGSKASAGTDESSTTESLERTDSLYHSPRPVQIVTAHTDHKFELDLDALEEVLHHEEVRDKPVVVLSVAGAFRKGKSFLLDFLLRFLDNTIGGKPRDKWFGDEEEPLTGFSWRGGVERNTTGILMWSKAYPMKLPNGEEVAVLIMDTQGAFDNQSTVKDCATIFALSTMISSVEVYNLSMMIQENDLQHLHLFTEYGRLALEQSKHKPFQTLCFLVRDWSYPYDHPFGIVGGKEYLDTVLKMTESQHEEIKLVRKHIKTCFETLNCFLMPHPGLKVATNPKFDGRLSDIDSEFKQFLYELIPTLLSPENLVIKKINGIPMTGKGLYQCFQSYMKIFESDSLPEPKSMLEATAEANNLAAQAAAFDRYTREMEELCGAEKPYLAPEKLSEEHEVIRMKCLEQFFEAPKMGGDVFSSEYMKKLEKMIDESYENFCKRNESKHLMNAYKTPAVLCSIVIVSYIISTILSYLGVGSLSQTCVLGLYIPLVLMVFWFYVRYTGSMRQLGLIIDNIASSVWEQVMQPVYQMILEKSLQRAVEVGMSRAAKKKSD